MTKKNRTPNEIYAEIMSLRDKVHNLNQQIDIHQRGIRQLLLERHYATRWNPTRERIRNFQINGNHVRILDLRYRIDNLNEQILSLHSEIDKILDSA